MTSERDSFFQRALLIEDNRAHSMLVSRALKNYVREVLVVETVGEAWKRLTSSSFDIVVSDLQLPDHQGASHLMRTRQIIGDVPLVVLTASTSLKDAVEAMKLGAQDFIVKEFDNAFSEVLYLCLQRLERRERELIEKRRLQREMEGLRGAIESSDDGLAVVSYSGKICYRNRAFARYVSTWGGSDSELGLSLPDIEVSGVSLREQIERQRCGLSIGAAWTTEFSLPQVAFQVLSLSLSIVPPTETSEVQPSAVLWLRDISTERRREQFQRELLSTTTHDLKGPLGAIMLSTELLKDVVVSLPKATEITDRIASSALSAVNLIDELLSARRIEEGNLILRPQPNEVGRLLENVVDGFKSIAVSRGIDLTIGSKCEVNAKFDHMGLSRVVSNLVANALKFTERGGKVVVDARPVRDKVNISVADTGCGMEPAEVSSLFRRFVRLEKHQDITGTGLGLFVARSIVAAHGGQIEVTSQVGQGSKFEILLPVNPPVNERGELVCSD